MSVCPSSNCHTVFEYFLINNFFYCSCKLDFRRTFLSLTNFTKRMTTLTRPSANSKFHSKDPAEVEVTTISLMFLSLRITSNTSSEIFKVSSNLLTTYLFSEKITRFWQMFEKLQTVFDFIISCIKVNKIASTLQ